MSWHLSSLSRVYRLNLSFNLLFGQIPLSLNHLPHLLTLCLNSNNFFGPILVLSLPNLQVLNLSLNSLTGPILPSLYSFLPASFSGNPTITTGSPTTTKLDQGIHLLGMNHGALIAIIAGDLAALLIAFTILFLYFWPKIRSKPPSYHLHKGEKIVFSSSKGGYGTAYKAVLQDKNVVAVKHLQETGSGFGKREFKQQMAILGRIQHPNIVSLKAYYYAHDKKLLVYEFMLGDSVYRT
ncbi:probable leucine-rich repeat receptor-like protein kinase At1g68400 [Dioscorea cayenensis subsp. rotundata]|uniref:Probable leucine-rich repeat receptor-like protein kinase At1g68400 n=1 Tax=Dioscorea cayennensis subsp. rotundata TaxID=55577 RepID=A0AB40BQJ0_DIOCR|nr:probable leucine-rich repeat receptor-like protein kinase At1g68400 [Dioscorea cayenensis subsp. rotundata]